MGLNIDSLKDLPVREFGEGEMVMTEGEPGGELVILVSGAVEILKQDIQINVVDSPGSIFGEISVLMDKPHMASVRALEPCKFHVAEDPCEFLKDNPEAHLHLSRLLASRLTCITSYLVDLKHQFEDQDDHLGMVDEVLESLLNKPTVKS